MVAKVLFQASTRHSPPRGKKLLNKWRFTSQGLLASPLSSGSVPSIGGADRKKTQLLLAESWQSSKRDRLIEGSLYFSSWGQWTVSGRGFILAESNLGKKVGERTGKNGGGKGRPFQGKERDWGPEAKEPPGGKRVK